MSVPVCLEWPIDSGIKGITPTQLISVRNLNEAELVELRDADADTILARCTGLASGQVVRLTQNDRAAIIAARQREMLA